MCEENRTVIYRVCISWSRRRHTKGEGRRVLSRWVALPVEGCNFLHRRLWPSRFRDWTDRGSWYAVFLWDKDTEKGKRLYRTNVFVFPVGLLTPSIYTNIGLFQFAAKCRWMLSYFFKKKMIVIFFQKNNQRMIADCKIIILYLHIDKIKFDYVKLNFRCFRLPVFRSGRVERLCIRDGISIVFE